MRIDATIWLDAITKKLAVKHCVEPDEVEKVLPSKPKFRFVEKSDRPTKTSPTGE